MTVCKKICFSKVDQDACGSLFEEFNAIDNYNTQNAYLFGLIDITKTSRRTKKLQFIAKIIYSSLCFDTKCLCQWSALKRCFDEYSEYCSKLRCTALSSDKFRRIFTEEYNIGFKSLKTDTCKDCDSMAIDLQHDKKDKNDLKIT